MSYPSLVTIETIRHIPLSRQIFFLSVGMFLFLKEYPKSTIPNTQLSPQTMSTTAITACTHASDVGIMN